MTKDYMEIRYVYNPVTVDIYMYKNRPVVIDPPAWGHLTIWTLDMIFIEAIEEYGSEFDTIYDKRIGKLIIPRWNREVLRWETTERGMTYERAFLNGQSKRC